MKKMLRRLFPNKQGFTLIEMTVVLFIVSILSLLIIPNVANMRDSIDAKGTAALADVIETQAELYNLDVGEEAPTLVVLQDAEYITAQQAEEATARNITLVNGEVSYPAPAPAAE